MSSKLISNSCKALLFAMAVLLGTGALAAEKTKLNVTQPFTVNGKQLPAGEYQLKWEGNGPSVDVSIINDGKVVATSSAAVVSLDRPERDSSFRLKDEAGGARSLSEVRMSGKKYMLSWDQESAAKQSSKREGGN
ncbi:MAG TPA: hypothetical protein VFA60_04900 [Terriglobales bacterium]|nr:hypothetical protein [Terriglobales bacterium]